MAEKISVKANPIQRNRLDVAMELTALHMERFGVDEGDLEKLFAKYHALACYCESNIHGLHDLITEEVKVAKKQNSTW